MASKHRTDDQDPDYLDNGTPRKRQRLIEEGAKEATVKRIETILRQQFGVEMKKKEQEIELIDQRIHQVRSMLDRLRACVVATYYGMPGQQPNGEKQPSTNEKSSLHPAVKKVLGQSTGVQSSVAEQPCDSAYSVTMETANTDMTGDIIKQVNSDEEEKMETEDKDNLVTKVTGVKGPRNQGNDTFGIVPRSLSPQSVSSLSSGPSRFHVKKRIVVGNISKYIAPDKREENDPSTHKWMVYVRGPLEEPRIDHFVKKVWFFLHPSYRPNDLVEVSEPPFHLTRRGWGEFPVRVQLHFLDLRNKKVDIIHNLKLDRTYTGLQTLGAETVVDVELDRYSVEDHESGEAKPATQENETEGKVESGMKEVTIQHSDSQGLKSADETEDASGVAATQAPTAAQITARIAAAQQLCSPKTKTAVQAATKLQASSVNESQSQIAQNGSKLISKAITATGTLSMPPLGPISCTKGNSNNAVSGTAITTTVIPQPSQAKVNPVRSVNTSGSFVMLSSQTSPTTGSVAVTTATSGAMTTKVRINQGKVEMSGQSTGAGLSSTSNIPQSKSDNTVVSPLPSQSSAVVKLTPSLSLPRNTVATTARSATPSVKMEVTSPPCKVKGQASIITSPQPRPQVAMPTAIAMPAGVTMTAPGVTMGTQYFIAAKSTDPNLQGKMILIPHQALVQATGQRLVAPVTQATGQRLVAPVSQATAQRLVAPVSQGTGQRLVAPVSQQITPQAVRPRGGASQIQRLAAPSQITAGKATTGIQRIATTVQGKGQSSQVRSQTPQSRGQTVQVRGAFPIPPGNVILIPQGANIPGIHPGSIVQIQQTMPVSKPQTLAAKTAQTGTQRVMMSPPTVTKTTVQLSPASSLPSSASTVSLSAQSPTSVLAKTAVNVGNQATTAVNVGNQATATVGSQATTAVAIGNQARASMGGSVTTIIKQVSPSLTPSSSSVTNVVAKTVVTPSTSKPIGTKLVLTKPVVHAIKPVSANADDAEDTDQKTTPQVIKLTKTSFLRPTSSSIATLEHAATSKVSMSTVPVAKVTAAVKPTTTIIGPRLPMDTVAKKLETGCLATASTINIDHVTSFEELVCHLVKRNPLIKKDRVQQEAPFCVTSVEQYRGWHIGKQRSAEWQRAAKVRKTLQEIVKLSEKWTDQDVWSVKSIMIWCRRHGYSIPDEANSEQILCDMCGKMKSERPIPDEKEKSDESFDGKCEKTVDTDKTGGKDEDISMRDDADDEEEEDEDEEEEDDDDDDDDDDENESEEDEDEEDVEDHKCKQEMLSDNGWLSTTSLTTCDSLCKEIEQRQSALQEDKNDDVDIDVVGVDENKITVKTEVQESSGAIQMYLPSTLHAEFVKNSCEEVGVKLPATEIAKDTYAPVMEEVLLAAMVEFMNDLMRDALAVAHGNRTDNRCPGEILPIHVYQSIVKNPKYSFLTNKHLGVVAMETGDANQPV